MDKLKLYAFDCDSGTRWFEARVFATSEKEAREYLEQEMAGDMEETVSDYDINLKYCKTPIKGDVTIEE